MTESTMEQTPVAAVRTDVLDQLMQPEIQQSLTVLVQNLPKLTEMVTLLTNTYDIVQNLVSDQVLIEDLKGGMEEIVTPIKDKAKTLAAAAIEANERAAVDTTTIGLFGMLKMLKDPQVQKMMRFSQAFLDVLSEQQKKQK